MHDHCCDVTGHIWQCSENCECICGLPMEGNDHNDCPVELRACAEHAGQDGLTAEVSPDAEGIDFSILSPERQRSRPHCECGCADLPRHWRWFLPVVRSCLRRLQPLDPSPALRQS